MRRPAFDSHDCLSATCFAQKLGFEPGPDQAPVLEHVRRGILCCHRQWGKSTIIAIKALHQALCHSGSLTLIASPGLRQSAETVRKSAMFARSLGMTTRGDGQNRVSLLFRNGSRIVGLPETEHTTVGFTEVSLLIFDEAARVPDPQYYALRPVLLATDGALWLLSTPQGKRGFFHREWSRGGDAWMRVHVPATANRRVRPAWIEEERISMPDSRFRQDYLCEFLQPDNAIFRTEDIQALFRDDIEPLDD